MSYLTQEEMVNVAETLVGAYEHLLSIYTQPQQDSAVRFSAELIMREIPYMIVTPDGSVRIRDMVFGHVGNRDYIMTLTHLLFARLAGDDEFIRGLCATLARGITMPKSAKNSLVPSDIKERLSPTDDVVEMLNDNLWLVTILLMQLFITIKPMEVNKS